jgi:hypothetical protein
MQTNVVSMAYITELPHSDGGHLAEKEKATPLFLDRPSKLGRALRQNTAETGGSSPKSYEGLLRIAEN